ncbi:class II aldolase/adducin family protein [Alicyclobacillus suci]|uniref:class II aldolase/adducin family protein n=1 Tax=Alicyclobacillus suci TaxID=2816080 RepID=UPI001A8D07BF|nr:class II aldolase/adducin family protein [Alicyclobacillus suci]
MRIPAQDEISLREKVALACLLINSSGLGDYSGHVSCKVPGSDNFYINGRMKSRAALTGEDILLCNANGEKLKGDDVAPAEIAIHSQIYKARSDVQSIAHFHPPEAVLFSVVARALKPVFLKGAMVGTVPVYDNPRHINSPQSGDELAATVGDGRAALLRGHGAVTVGSTVEEVFFLAVCLEENARRYRECLVLGEPKPLSEEEIRDIRQSGYKPERFRKIWNYYRSKM